MPRSSPYTITLSSAEAAKLRRRSTKYTLPYFQVQRAKMILYAAQGMSNDEIAVYLDTRREVASRRTSWRRQSESCYCRRAPLQVFSFRVGPQFLY